MIKKRITEKPKLIVIGKQKTAEDLFYEGKIIPVRLIYEVKFKPIFKIRDMLGQIADKLKLHYSETSIFQDENKNNEDIISFVQSEINTYIGMNLFKVINTSLRGEINIDEILWSINNIPNKLIGFNFLKLTEEEKKLEIQRIGIRIEYIGSIIHNPKLSELDKSLIFNSQFLEDLGCIKKEDKLFNLYFKIGEDTEKTGDKETVMSIQAKSGVNLEGLWFLISKSILKKLNDKFDKEKMKLLSSLKGHLFFQEELNDLLEQEKFKAEEIELVKFYAEKKAVTYRFNSVGYFDFIRGYFKPEDIKRDYLDETIELAQKTIFKLFKERV